MASIGFAGQGSHSFGGVRSGPGLPFNYNTHVPYVGNQRWGSGVRPYGGQSRPGFGNHRPYRYPGLLAFPFFPVSDWGGYLGDSNPYYDETAPAPDASSAPDQYMGPQQPPPGYYPGPQYPPPPQAYYPAPQPQDPYAAQQAEPDAHPAEALPPIVLVLHNGQKLQISNYAVVNDVIWDFSKPAARKIAVASIDLAASAKATQDSGGEFPDFNAPRAEQNP
jgi:hypothetical protein